MVRIDGEWAAFNEVPEVLDCPHYSKQFPVECRVFLLCWGQLLRKEGNRPEFSFHFLFQHPANGYVGSIHRKGGLCVLTRLTEQGGRGQRRLCVLEGHVAVLIPFDGLALLGLVSDCLVEGDQLLGNVGHESMVIVDHAQKPL